MIVSIRGKLIESTLSYVVIDTGGIGYKIWINCQLFHLLPSVGEECILYTSHVIREISQTLYGFMTKQERDLFELLMCVSGIGPKLALSICGHLPLKDLHKAIANYDVDKISKVPGLGKKTTEKLIIELRDKIQSFVVHDPSEFSIQIPEDSNTQKIRDAIGALVNLGYNQNVAQKAIRQSIKDLPDGVDLPALITHSLQNV